MKEDNRGFYGVLGAVWTALMNGNLEKEKKKSREESKKRKGGRKNPLRSMCFHAQNIQQFY